jgi:hypothetical protein
VARGEEWPRASALEEEYVSMVTGKAKPYVQAACNVTLVTLAAGFTIYGATHSGGTKVM